MLATALLAALPAVGLVAAQQPYSTRVHSSVIFTRGGEHTPHVLPIFPMTLTSFGAQQLYRVGGTFRDRYMGFASSANPLSINRVVGLANSSIDENQIVLFTPDNPHLSASALAFMQGLYPPATVKSSDAGVLDPTSVLANNTYVEYPLGGYQYPPIQTFGDDDFGSIYLTGDINCIKRSNSAGDYTSTKEYTDTLANTTSLYVNVGDAIGELVGQTQLAEILAPSQWSYANAYQIYEYLNYQVSHNTEVRKLLTNNTGYISVYPQLRYFASRQQWAFYGENSVDGGIRTIAGQTLATKILSLLQTNVNTKGESGKINLLFGDYQPFISFFALARLQELNTNFKSLPDYGSSMVFELFSQGNPDNTTFPNESELWVKFYFRNGSSASTDLQAYPIFSRGPSETDIKWTDFVHELQRLTVTPSSWCNACGAVKTFCFSYNITGGQGTHDAGSGMSPQVAGVIGAAVTLGAVGALLALAILAGGIRFHRANRSDLGGFKGSAKLASDTDLAIPRAAPMPVSASIDDAKARERVGSWELRNKEVGRPITREEDDISVNPFADPVKPIDRV